MPGFGPSGGAPFGGSGGASAYSDTLACGLGVVPAAGVTDIRVAIADALQLAPAVLGVDLPNLIDAINITGGSINVYTKLRHQLGEGITFTDVVLVVWDLLLADGVATVPAAIAKPFFLGALADALQAIGLVEGNLEAHAALVGALAFESLISNGWTVEALDQVGFADALEAAARFIGPLVDGLLVATTASNTLRLSVITNDSLAIPTSLAAALELAAELHDQVLVFAALRLGTEEYSAWALNTESRAPSEYTNFPFESLVSATEGAFKGRSFGAGEGGIYELVGDDDDGDPIQAYIRTGLSELGLSNNKRLPDVYFGVSGEGQLVLKVITTRENGEKVEDWYLQQPDGRTGAGLRGGRFKPGGGLKSAVWGFEIHNKAGGTIDLSRLELRRLVLSRRT